MWGHYSSKDMVYYEYEGIAIFPDEVYDRDSAYSGSAISRNDEK